MTAEAYMNVYFLYDAAARFASLDADAAKQVIRVLTQSTPPPDPVPLHNRSIFEAAGGILSVHTADADLWVGAFAESQDLTVVSLGSEEPGEGIFARIRALTRAQKRPTLGGLSLGENSGDIQESVRALLTEERQWMRSTVLRYDSPEVWLDPHVDGRNAEVSRRASRNLLVHQLARSARRWRTTQARRDFKDVLLEASTAPQMVERDGQEVLIIDRELLERYEQPLSGAALAARFAPNRLSPLIFADEMATEPEPEIRLGARA